MALSVGLIETKVPPVDNPFDPRHEVSADAEHIAKAVGGRIVMHMWIIFVALSFVLGLLYAILK